MNLHAIAGPVIAAVNPFVTVSVQQSTGYTTAADGTRSPTYTTISVSAQVQPLSFSDIQHADALNIQGSRRKVYVNGALNGLVRFQMKGGDLVTLPDGSVWIVAFVSEQWPDWVSVVVTLQDGS